MKIGTKARSVRSLEKTAEEKSMIKTEDDILYNRIKNSIGFDRSQKHLKFIRQYGTPHHLFGSYSQSLKTSDYGTIPVTAEEHEYAEKHKSEFAVENLHILIKFLIRRIKELGG